MSRLTLLGTMLALAVGTVAAAAEPRACQTADEADPKTFLPDNDPTVIATKVPIESQVRSYTNSASE